MQSKNERMPSSLRSAIQTAFFSTLVVSALAHSAIGDVSNEEAKRFSEVQRAALADLAAKLPVIIAATSANLAAGECSTKIEEPILKVADAIEQFDQQQDAARKQLRAGLPMDDYVASIIKSALSATSNMRALMFISVADAAMRGNCLDLADKYYRNVVSLAIVSDPIVRRAMIGIEDVRVKKLQQPSTQPKPSGRGQ